tara:strand:- start:8996 stop:9433 length:438 start_codon:yes stop_codon:yes gene_type:complete
LNKTKNKKIAFYVNSYYQARDVIYTAKKFSIIPFIGFKYYIVKNIGIIWIAEINKLLLEEFNNNDYKVLIDCRNNPALVINCIKKGFFYINFNANQIIQKNIKDISNQSKTTLNPLVKIIDMRQIKNCKNYTNRILINFKEGKNG